MFSVSRPVMRKGDLETLPEAAEKAIEAAVRAEQIENELIGLKEEDNRLSELLRGWDWMSPWILRERTEPVPFSERFRRERA